MTTTRRVGIIGGVRIPFCRNNTAYADIGNFGMSVKVLGSLVERFGLHGLELGEVAMGAVIKHVFDWNLAREATLSSGLAPTTPGITTVRACGSSLDNTINVGNKIAMGQIEAGIAGGSDTTSDVPSSTCHCTFWVTRARFEVRLRNRPVDSSASFPARSR